MSTPENGTTDEFQVDDVVDDETITGAEESDDFADAEPVADLSAPVDAEPADPVSAGFSRAYLHHLFKASEVLGQRLLSQHNLAFYMNLMREIRVAIEADRFAEWSSAWLARYRAGADSSSDATQSAARAGSCSPS